MQTLTYNVGFTVVGWAKVCKALINILEHLFDIDGVNRNPSGKIT